MIKNEHSYQHLKLKSLYLINRCFYFNKYYTDLKNDFKEKCKEENKEMHDLNIKKKKRNSKKHNKSIRVSISNQQTIYEENYENESEINDDHYVTELIYSLDEKQGEEKQIITETKLELSKPKVTKTEDVSDCSYIF